MNRYKHTASDVEGTFNSPPMSIYLYYLFLAPALKATRNN